VLRLGAQCAFSIVLLSFISFNAESRTFKNAYISFEMQDNWKCSLEQTEWVCRAEDPQEAKEAVIILTAKEVGPTDTFPQYESHMNSAINTVTRTGIALTSSVKYKAQSKKINDQPWLDGLHQDSEVQNYFTRYLATIKDQIAILVTFSAHNKLYAKHSSNFDKTIQSLRVIATKDLIRPDLGPLKGGSGELIGSTNGAMPNDMLASDDASSGKGKKGLFQNKAVLGLGLLILAALIYIISKIMNKRK
jgi:hypothetical protein